MALHSDAAAMQDLFSSTWDSNWETESLDPHSGNASTGNPAYYGPFATWTPKDKLLASNGRSGDLFGWSVAIDGTMVVVGAPEYDKDEGLVKIWDSGIVYVFEHNGSSWTQSSELQGLDDNHLGYDVAISRNQISAGSPFVRVLDFDNPVPQVVNGAGRVDLFDVDGSNWSLGDYLLINDGSVTNLDVKANLGYSVAFDEYVVAGAPGHRLSAGGVFGYLDTMSGWRQVFHLMPADWTQDDFFGGSVATEGARIIVGASGGDDRGHNSGAAYAFEYTGSEWTEQKLLPADGVAEDYFGSCVAISDATVVIGAAYDDDNGENSGAVYVFGDSGSGWEQAAKLVPSDGAAGDFFGLSVAIHGSVIAVGAPYDDDAGHDSGSVYIFRSTEAGWVEEAKLIAVDGAQKEFFGFSVALSGVNLVVGAPYADDKDLDSGAVYVYEANGSNTAPSIGYLTDSPDPVTIGTNVWLTANNVFDPDVGDRVTTRFYRESNLTTGLQVDEDHLVGTDTNAADGWEVPVDTASLAAGIYTYYAQVTDQYGATSPVVSTVNTVLGPIAPEIAILGNGLTIIDGDVTPSAADHTDFGSVEVDGGSITRTLTVQNIGSAALALTGTPKVTVTGLHAADFTITVQPSSPVAPGGSTTFEIRFAPGVAGRREATVVIANDDSDENPYDFLIAGTGRTGGSATCIGISWTGSVYTIDPETGHSVLLGNTGYSSTNSLAVDGAGRVLTVVGAAEGNPAFLAQIDKNSGTATRLVNISGPLTNVRSLAFSPNGELFADGLRDGGGRGLFKIDVATGVSSAVGIGVSNVGFQGLDFAADGTLFGWSVYGGMLGGLYRIDPETGEETDVNPDVGDIAYSPQTIAFGPDGQLYAAAERWYRIDPTTGIATLLGTGLSGIRGIGFVSADTPILPFTLTVVGNQTVDEGSPLSITDMGKLTTQGSDSPSTTFPFTIDWGDGTPRDIGVATIDTPGGTGVPTAGSFDGSHIYADNGTYTVTVTVTDDDGGADTRTFAVTVNNVAPALTVAGNQTAAEGTATSFTLGSFTDPGDDDPWVVTVAWGDTTTDTFNVNTPGSLDNLSHTYADDGVHTVSITIGEDSGTGATGMGSFQVAVANVAPFVAHPIADVVVNEDAPDTLVELSGVFVDPGSDSLTLSVAGNSDPTLVTATISGSLLTLDYLPNQSGRSSVIRVRASDGTNFAEDEFRVTVNPVPDPPFVANPIPDRTVQLGSATTITVDLTNVFSDLDLPHDTLMLSYNNHSDNTNLSLVPSGTLAGSTLTLMLAAGGFGRADITVHASDSTSRQTSDTFSVIVNARPTAWDDSVTTSAEVAIDISVFSNDTDVDGTIVPSSVSVVPGNGPSNGTITGINNGVVTYLPNVNFSGTDSFRYTIQDNDGATSGPALVTITVRVKGPPWQNPDNIYDVNADGSVSPFDALLIIDCINAFGVGQLPAGSPPPYYDVNGDGWLGVQDVLYVVNVLNGLNAQAADVPEYQASEDPKLAAISLHATDLNGNPISGGQVQVGEQFMLWVMAEDLRQVPPATPGVYSAYTDVTYDPLLASPLAAVTPLGFDIAFGPDFRAGQSGVSRPELGLIDDVGAFQGLSAVRFAGQTLLFAVTFTALAEGLAEFSSNAADVQPLHEITLISPPTQVPPSQVRFGTTTVKIVPGVPDGDGIPAHVENAAPNGGDGNRDGVPDAQQAHVASLPHPESGTYVTLAAAETAQWKDVAFVDVAVGGAPEGMEFVLDLLSFTLAGVSPNGALPVQVIVHDSLALNAFYACGSTARYPYEHWYPFLFDGASGAAMAADGGIVVHLADGGRGDRDLAADGQIVVLLGPAINNHPSPWQNPHVRFDVNMDYFIAPRDVLDLINDINAYDVRELPVPPLAPKLPRLYLDVDGNNRIEPRDVLDLINELNARGNREVPPPTTSATGNAATPATGAGEAEAAGSGLPMPLWREAELNRPPFPDEAFRNAAMRRRGEVRPLPQSSVLAADGGRWAPTAPESRVELRLAELQGENCREIDEFWREGLLDDGGLASVLDELAATLAAARA